MRGKKERGITLIALIITIIVMLILVAVTVTTAINGGIFKKAGEAVSKTRDSMKNEQDAVNQLLAEMEKYQSGGGNTGTPTDPDGPSIDEIKITDKTSESIEIEVKTTNAEGGTYKYYLDEEENGKEVAENTHTYAGLRGGKEYTLKVEVTNKEGKTATDSIKGITMASIGTYTEVTTEYKDKEENTAIIPSGFKVSTNPDEQTIDDGLVIQDEEGNEFVWIPVDNMDSFKRTEWKNNARSTDLTSSSDYTEPYASGYPTEQDDYDAMKQSVQTNKGFYIGRYESGSQDSSGNPKARTNTANGNSGKVVVKKDQYPYNYVGWGSAMNEVEKEVKDAGNNQGHGAVYLSKHFYDGKKVGVEPTLTYGVQWDAVLDFIKDSKHDVTNSTSWGNYEDSTYTTSVTSSYLTDNGTNWTKGSYSKSSSSRVLLTTGASESFKAKNLYDIAGNVTELTMETNPGMLRAVRGGSYFYYGSYHPASVRVGNTFELCLDSQGFRVALYIKNS